MIKDQTLDEALLEIMRTKKALELLRGSRKRGPSFGRYGLSAEHAAAKRASLDLTRKLADLRAGR
jgi:hypothetical protein